LAGSARSSFCRPTSKLPPEERTPELEARIEKAIERKVGEFIRERRLKAYEAGLRRELAERHPNLTERQRLEYNQRILELVAERREAMARQKQQQLPPARRRGQEQGLER
jgi:hypothetical protein